MRSWTKAKVSWTAAVIPSSPTEEGYGQDINQYRLIYIIYDNILMRCISKTISKDHISTELILLIRLWQARDSSTIFR